MGSQVVLISGALTAIGIRQELRKADMGVTATLSRVERDGKDKRLPDPCIVVVFGASARRASPPRQLATSEERPRLAADVEVRPLRAACLVSRGHFSASSSVA